MIKVVCFDFFNTLAYFDPSREDFYSSIAAEYGIKATPEAIAAALPEADTYWRKENFKSPIHDREEKEKYATYTQYALLIFTQAESRPTPQQALQILGKAFAAGFKFVAFDDSLSALKAVKRKNYKTGLISNVGQEIDSHCDELGFSPYLDFKVTSFEVGYDKPHPKIFQHALSKAGVSASEAVYIGDQYDQDIVGARGVGMQSILINRQKNTGKYDCPIITNLTEIDYYLS